MQFRRDVCLLTIYHIYARENLNNFTLGIIFPPLVPYRSGPVCILLLYKHNMSTAADACDTERRAVSYGWEKDLKMNGVIYFSLNYSKYMIKKNIYILNT